MTKKKLIKVHEWLAKHTHSHEIYDHAKMVEKFKQETGEDAPWHGYTPAQTRSNIEARGKGGTLSKKKMLMCYGYAMAEACSSKWTSFVPWQMGLGFRWQSAVAALKEAGK